MSKDAILKHFKGNLQAACVICGKQFSKKAHNQITCSLPCKQECKRLTSHIASTSEKAKARRNELRQLNPEKYRQKDRERYAKNINGYKTKRKLRNKRVKIGTLIRAEYMQIPLYGQKRLWTGKGRWSKSYYECVECNTTIYKHGANGVCVSCYDKLKAEAAGIKYKMKRKLRKQELDKKYKERATVKKQLAEKFIGLAEGNKIPVTNTIKNLLNNLV